ncbi:MAG: MgtC/SapB family protein [Spirochaetales bacterium]|nr:MgtC/SapB family protein [Spirochaetales bacterium]
MHFDITPMIKWFTLADCIDLGMRVVLSAICGAIIGLERERRYKNAGLRTHIIVAIAGAILMIVSKYGFIDVASIPDIRLTSDSGRIAAGVIQSIGFLGAGVIYIRKESVMGLTTAAGLWATVGIGLAFGAGMYVLGISTTAIIMLVHLLLRIHHQKMPTQTVGVITCNLTKHDMTIDSLVYHFKEVGATLRDFSYTRSEDVGVVIKANVVFSDKRSIIEHVEIMKNFDFIDSFEVYP